MLIQGSRTARVMGEDHPRIAFFARVSRRGIPAVAVAVQAALALLLVATASFDTLLTYIGVTLSLSTAGTVVGVFWLRWRRPALCRPYRAWGYPATPIFFLALSLWMIGHTLSERPIVAALAIATIAAGLVLYRLAGARHLAPTSIAEGSPR
jgi:APA family basic amino acid/polyamine antiporter